jgi:cytochrome c biogenesis protein CcmG, thiol:disulfide interchange protein DsbE
MKRWLAMAACKSVLVLMGGLFAGVSFALEPGQAVPDLELAGKEGRQKLSAYKGKVVYIDFWASWCGPCRQSFPWLNEMQKKYASQGLQVVGVNLDARREDADQFLKEVPAQFPLLFDPKGDSARAFGVKAMPTSYLIDAQGKVVHVHRSFRNDQRQELEERLTQALGIKAK